MSKKQKTAKDAKQPLTEDFYSVSEGLIEHVPFTPLIKEELQKIAQCYRKKNPENRKKFWNEYQQSQTVERPPSPTSDEDKPESRVEEVKELGPLARLIHYPLTPVVAKSATNIDVEFSAWIRALPPSGCDSLDSFKFLPSNMHQSFEFMRLTLESRLDTAMSGLRWEQLVKPHGFERFDSRIEHPNYVLLSFNSSQFYLFLVFLPNGPFINYFVQAC
jgi:hypothetical protein